jgi:hypothetical protein
MENCRASALALSYKTIDYKNEPKHLLHLGEKEYKEILKAFYKKLAYYLITTGDEINLPSRIGSLQAVKYKKKRKSIDFHATKKYFGEYNKNKPQGQKKKVYHENRLTQGYQTRIHWSKLHKANFKNKKMYKFNLTRPNVRPNSYNKNNPEVSLVPFFREKGWIIYSEYNPNLKKINKI